MKKIIKFQEDASEESIKQEKDKILKFGGKITYSSSLFRIVVVESDDDKYIKKLNHIDKIENNNIGYLEKYEIKPNLDISLTDYNVFERYGDVKVAVIDSAIMGTDCNVVKRVDFTGKGLTTTDVIHADVVADIINKIGPGVQIFNAKIAHDASYETENLIKALDWAAQEKVNIINLSLGADTFSCYGNCIICDAVATLRKYNILSVVAAGNSGPDKSTIECPGNCSDAITVGGLDLKGNAVACFSSRGKPDQLKPDVITSSYVIAKSRQSDKSGEISGYHYGTSFSTPVITGACVKAYGRFKNVSVVEKIIYKSTVDVDGDYQDCGRGAFSFKKMAECMREGNFYESQIDNQNIS